MDCPNLRALYPQYKIGRDPSYFKEYGPNAHKPDPWYDLVLCEYGTIGPYGRGKLCASSAGPGRIAAQLMRLDCCQVIQDGSDGCLVAYPVQDFGRVATLLKPRRKRVLSPEHKAKLSIAGRRALAA